MSNDSEAAGACRGRHVVEDGLVPHVSHHNSVDFNLVLFGLGNLLTCSHPIRFSFFSQLRSYLQNYHLAHACQRE